MATDWRLEGDWVKNCSCAYGCPCDFNARPTQGWCKGLLAMDVKRGHFGDVKLDGLKFAVTVDYPGALHEGNGTIQTMIDERASEAQGAALFEIFSGKHSKEGTFVHIVSLIVARIEEPVFAPIRFEFDMDRRRAMISIPGMLETEVEPIKNPVTGAEHRIQVNMPEGFEHRSAEVASCSIRSTGAIKYEGSGVHSSLARVTQTQDGVVA